MSPAEQILDDQTTSTHSVLTPSVTSNVQRYSQLEAQLKRQQAELASGLTWSSTRLTAIEHQLTKLHRLDELEEKLVSSMQYHVDTNAALALLKQQMEAMMLMMTTMVQAAGNNVPLSAPASATRVRKLQSTGSDVINCNGTTTLVQQSFHGTKAGPVNSPQKKKHRPAAEDMDLSVSSDASNFWEDDMLLLEDTHSRGRRSVSKFQWRRQRILKITRRRRNTPPLLRSDNKLSREFDICPFLPRTRVSNRQP